MACEAEGVCARACLIPGVGRRGYSGGDASPGHMHPIVEDSHAPKPWFDPRNENESEGRLARHRVGACAGMTNGIVISDWRHTD